MVHLPGCSVRLAARGSIPEADLHIHVRYLNSSSLTKTTQRGVILTARTLRMPLIYGFCDAVLQEVQTGVSRSARSYIIDAQLIMIDQGVYTG